MMEITTTDLLAKIGSLVMENEALRQAVAQLQQQVEELERPVTDEPPPKSEKRGGES